MALNINGTTGISGVDGSASAPAITGDDADTGISFPSANTIKFSAGGVEKFAISASGLSGDGSGLTGIGGEITNLSVWYMTTSFTGGANPVLNWLQYSLDGNTTGFGSAMTESSGIWTFPSAGFWQVNVQAYAYGSTGHDSYSIFTQISTDSGSSYAGAPRRSYSNIPAISGSWYSQNQNTFYYDITNASTTRLKVVIDGNPDNINNGGTLARFMRLADT